MREVKRRDSGGFAHHSLSVKSKASVHNRYKIFDGEYSKVQGYTIGIIIMVLALSGLVIWSISPTNPLFHSVEPNKIGDPTTLIWADSWESNDASNWNLSPRAFYKTQTISGTAYKGILLAPFGSHVMATAISKEPVVLSVSANKVLQLLFSYYENFSLGAPGSGQSFSVYLTTNNTIPTDCFFCYGSHSYDPIYDKSVALVFRA